MNESLKAFLPLKKIVPNREQQQRSNVCNMQENSNKTNMNFSVAE